MHNYYVLDTAVAALPKADLAALALQGLEGIQFSSAE
jgi:hypothetical protein